MEHGGHHVMNHIWQKRWPHLAFARSGLHLRHTGRVERMLLMLFTVLLMRRGHGRHDLVGSIIFLFLMTRSTLLRMYYLQITVDKVVPSADCKSRCGDTACRCQEKCSSCYWKEDFRNCFSINQPNHSCGTCGAGGCLMLPNRKSSVSAEEFSASQYEFNHSKAHNFASSSQIELFRCRFQDGYRLNCEMLLATISNHLGEMSHFRTVDHILPKNIGTSKEYWCSTLVLTKNSVFTIFTPKTCYYFNLQTLLNSITMVSVDVKYNLL